MNTGPIKLLVVDDSALYRQSVQNVLRDFRSISIVGTATNGVEALEKIESLDPDLLTLDVQMPDMDGIEVLREIKRRRLRPKAIVLSGFTTQGAQVTTDALMEGAFDFILKPSGSDALENRQQLRDSLEQKIVAFRDASQSRSTRRRGSAAARLSTDGVSEQAPTPGTACQAVILGTSTGGPEALKIVLPRLPANLDVPVLVVQHMPAQFTRSLAARLDDICPLPVVEGRDELEVAAGSVVLAPGGKQTKLQVSADRLLLRVNDDPPELGVRPSVNYLVRSASNVLEGNLLTVILTGMGRDGLESCRQLKQTGGYVFAQHQDDCVVYGMPKAIIEAKLADRVLPLGKIAPAIVRHVKRSRRA